MNIPEQLRKEKYRFVPVEKGMKAPHEKNWPEENNYPYDDEKIQKAINNGGNYGVVCGYGNLVVIDADDQEVADAVTQNLPPTLVVGTGGGGFHFYYRCPNLDKPIRLKGEQAGDVGDVQSTGKQVVGPGSTHPSGNKYKIERNNQIAKVEVEEIKFALRRWLKEIKDSGKTKKKENFDIDITDVVNLSGLKRDGDEYYGEHPIHGSGQREKGNEPKNFWVNTSKNVWHCFRHETGGGPMLWLAVKLGIIDCDEAVPGALDDTKKFREVLNELEKEGLYEPDTKSGKAILPYFTDKGKFIPRALAQEIMESKDYVVHPISEMIYVYENGIYKERGELDIRGEAQERLGSLSKANYKNEVVSYIRDHREVQKDPEKFGGPKELLPCENGLIDLKKDELKDFTPEHIFLSKIPVEYDPDAECPKTKEFVEEIVNEDDIKLVQEMFGYCLWTGYPLAKAFMLIGGGANGKSTLLNLLTTLLDDDNTCSPSLQELLNNRFKKIELFGKLANIHADLGVEALEDTGTFKMLTGGDKIMGEKKGKDPMEFYNHAKLIFSANEYPSTKDRTDAFFRRWIVIKFPNQFLEGEEETDPNILKKLMTDEELSGVLNWAIKGLQRVLKEGHFSRTDSRNEVEGEWIRRTDSLRAFLDENIRYKQDVKITKELFFKLYKGYCRQHDLYSMKKGPVTKAVPSKEPRTEIYQPLIGDKQIRCWRNIDIKSGIVNKDFFKETLKRLLQDMENTQDKPTELYSSLAMENKKIHSIVSSWDMPAYPAYIQPSEEEQKTIENVEPLNTDDRSQQEKASALQDLAYKLGQEEGTITTEVLKKEAEAEGISEDFVVVWLQNQGESIHEENT